MTTQPTAPLAMLYQHTFNPRQTHDSEDITALAHSIAVNGLLQNLSGYRDSKDGIGIVAGGRRLAALQYIHQNPTEFEGGTLPDFDAIPVNITADATLARSWAGAEAATQRPLHPAEEISYYADLASTGATPDNIARAFGCTTAHVKRRLKLASLPAETMAALRADEISLDAAGHLTLCTTPEQHAQMLETAIRNPRSGMWLKQKILEDRVEGTDRRAIFVGAELYTMEGGAVEEDLFAEEMVFADEALLQKLFEQKVATSAERITAEQGYAKTVPIFETHVSYTHTQTLTRPERIPLDLPEADAKELEQLLERGNNEEELTDAEIYRMDELEDRARGSYSDEDIAAGTAFAYVDRTGKLQIEGPYLPRAGTQTATDNEGSATQIPAKPPITQGGLDDLKRIQSLALQTKLIDKPELMLDLLAFQLAHGLPGYAGPLNVQISEQAITPSNTDEVRIDKRLTEDDESLTTPPAEAFTAFKELGKAHRNKVLARTLARTLNQPFHNPLNAALCETMDVSPRDVWTPTADNHFKACSVPTLDAIWRELVIQDGEGDAEMERFAKLKKGEKAKELEALFNDASVQEALGLSRAQVAAIDAWVPVMLRGDH